MLKMIWLLTVSRTSSGFLHRLYFEFVWLELNESGLALQTGPTAVPSPRISSSLLFGSDNILMLGQII